MTHVQVVGIGSSQEPDSATAGKIAARAAREAIGVEQSPGWAMLFVGGKHNPAQLLAGMRSQLGNINIVGGTGVGVITNTALSYTGYECAVAVFPDGLPLPAIIVENNLERGERAVGRQLGQKLAAATNPNDTVLLFYDSVKSGPPPLLYIGSQLMDGIYEGLAEKPLRLVGAGMLGDFQFTNSYVLNGQAAVKHSVVAVVLPACWCSHTAIMHGCTPVSSFFEITRIEGAVLYQIDGRPALEVLADTFGNLKNYSLALTIGEKHGDIYAPYDESAYVNRLILNTDPATGSVTLFETDFAVGTKIQIMARDNQLMLESVRQRTKQLLATLSQPPVFAFYINCAGRASVFSGSEIEEAAVLQENLGADIPLVGFYSGVEIAPLLGRSRPLDWTGVLTLFTLEVGPNGQYYQRTGVSAPAV